VAIITETNRAFRYNAQISAILDHEKTLKMELLAETSVLATSGAPIGALLSVLLAVTLAHVLLLVGGFTGSSGAKNKLVDWIRVGAASVV
jgi:hypothetical protein